MIMLMMRRRMGMMKKRMGMIRMMIVMRMLVRMNI
jgi:hypothetical protein